MTDFSSSSKDGVISNQASHIEWVDIYKGIAIIMMVIGHSNSPITLYIYLFHMSAFIFISGFTGNFARYSLLSYIKRKVLTILVPYIVINLTYIFVYSGMQSLGLYKYLHNDAGISLQNRLINFVKHQSTADLGGATWFLLALFFIEIFYMIIFKLSEKFKRGNIAPFVGLGLGVVGFYLCMSKPNMILSLDLSLYGLLFYSLGVIFKKYNVFIDKIDNKFMFIVSLTVMFTFEKFGFINWPTRDFNLIFNLITSTAGIYLLYCLSSFLQYFITIKKVLIFLGRITFCILVTHFAVFKVVSLLLILANIYSPEILKSLTPPISPYLTWFVYSLLTLAICSLLSIIGSKNRVLNYYINGKMVTK